MENKISHIDYSVIIYVEYLLKHILQKKKQQQQQQENNATFSTINTSNGNSNITSNDISLLIYLYVIWPRIIKENSIP